MPKQSWNVFSYCCKFIAQSVNVNIKSQSTTPDQSPKLVILSIIFLTDGIISLVDQPQFKRFELRYLRNFTIGTCEYFSRSQHYGQQLNRTAELSPVLLTPNLKITLAKRTHKPRFFSGLTYRFIKIERKCIGMTTKIIYVLNANGEPLMPTHRLGKVRRWLNNGLISHD